VEGYRRLAGATDIRIAAGEWLQTRYEFLDLMDRGQVDLIQPDVGRVGGFTEAMRVVQLARDRGKLVVPHCWKAGIGAATAHLAAVSPNCRFIEFLPAAIADSQLRRELVSNALKIDKGRLGLPQRPGLGISLNSDAFSRFAAAAERFYSPRLLPQESMT
jgi:L-alanine-DL-glutamate epimerase-like enolase superfamily enzyme